ncbi:MAG: RagB/SusD family nutrient uptake outer membrane protein, partial [Bacteroidia bacterium]
VAFDGVKTKTWGGTTFIIHAAVGGSMAPADYGIDGGWGGLRVTSAIVGKFFDLSLLKSKPGSLSKAYPVLYVPGDHNGWGHDADNVVASVASDEKYEGYFMMESGKGFKIDSSTDWSNDHGDNGMDGTLDRPGDNIVVPENGYFKINVDWTAKTYTMVKTDWGLIGDATPGGWNNDTNLEYDAATKTWTLIVELGTGKIKFRANDGWDINYGDNGADGILEAGGSDIDITEPGKYLVTLKLGAPDYTYTVVKYASDERGMFYSDGQSLEITDIFEFTEGYAVTKFKNLTVGGAQGSHATFVDNDFPMFRIADVYLMYAEAVLRGGSGGSEAIALTLVNDVITRGYGGDASSNITADDLSLDFILDERARELLWEGHRRTDLVRFGKFSDTDYLWAFKGGVQEGKSVDSKFDIYPLPASDIAANPNLVQIYY